MTGVGDPSSSAATVSRLSGKQRATLDTVCQTLLPALPADAGDDGPLFAYDGLQLGVPDAVARALALSSADQQSQLGLLLTALEQPLMMLALGTPARGFTGLNAQDRERALRSMATSTIPQLRTGFQALKRLATFLFYALPGTEGNPVWPLIGYIPSGNPAPRGAALTLTAIRRPTTLACDVCVIGSGAGGGVVAAELAATGKDVIVLEAGPGDQSSDFDQRELAGMDRLYLDRGTTATRDLSVAILAGACLGGGTAVNWQTSLRTPASVRDEWAGLSGSQDFVEESFTRSLDAVCERVGVGTSESSVNANNAVIARGCGALGLSVVTLPRNARGCDPAECGYCVFGCRIGGKQSAAATFLHDAQRHGARVIASCRVDRIVRSKGHATGVESTVTDGPRRHALVVHAPVVVVAAGGIESPALLLRSGLELPALGRNLLLHPTTAVTGRYAAPVRPWSGPPQTIMCDAFSEMNGSYGFRLESAPAHPGLLALALPWFSARHHRRHMQSCAALSPVIVLARDRVGGRVRVSRDGRALIDYAPDAAVRAVLRKGIVAAVRVHLAAGADEVLTLHTREHSLRATPTTTPRDIEVFCDRIARSPVDANWCGLFSAHQMGTCRLGRDSRTAVCDVSGGVFGVRGLFVADASAFPASSGVNPMITVMALAHRIAQGIKALS
jgi:choline dehydrogenase-like flavoprotein